MVVSFTKINKDKLYRTILGSWQQLLY